MTLDNVTLINGDADGTDNVTTEDVPIVVAAMDSRPGDTHWNNGRADLDGDNETTSSDLAIVMASVTGVIAGEGQHEPTVTPTPTPTPTPIPESATVRFTASPTQIYPGDNFTLTVEVVTDNVTVSCLDYWVQVEESGTGLFTLTDRNTDNSTFPDLFYPNLMVLDSSYALLNPQNGLDLAALVTDPNTPAGPGTMLVATLTITSDPAVSPGTYTFSPVGLSVGDGSFNNIDNITAETATVEVLEGGQQNRMQQNSAQSPSETLSLNQKIENWLRDKLGNDYATFNPDSPPSYLSRQDAETAAFLWFWLQSGQ